MKIMFNTMNLGKGGAERVINILAGEFSNNNKIKIVTHLNMPVEYKFNDNIEIVSIEKKHRNSQICKFLSRISLNKLLRLKKEILSFKPDIIISFLPEPSFRILFLKKIDKRIKKIPVIVSVRNDPEEEYNNLLYKTIMKNLYPYANQLVLQTNDAKQYFKKEINYIGEVIPNPVSDEFLINRYEGEREKKIVAVGRLNKQKNYINMIDAFKIVNKTHNDYILEIYGDGFLKNDIQNYINENNLSDSIKLMGKTSNVKEAIYKATAFVMSSDYEGMPNALLEASCLGIPCVSTDCPCGGPKEILENGSCGLLVPVRDSIALANAICKLIDNPKLLIEFSKRCNENSIKYEKGRIIEMWKKIIDELNSTGGNIDEVVKSKMV